MTKGKCGIMSVLNMSTSVSARSRDTRSSSTTSPSRASSGDVEPPTAASSGSGCWTTGPGRCRRRRSWTCCSSACMRLVVLVRVCTSQGPRWHTSRASLNCRGVGRGGTRSACPGAHICCSQRLRSRRVHGHCPPVANVLALRAVAADLQREAVLARLGEQLRRGGTLGGEVRARRGKRHGVHGFSDALRMQSWAARRK
jgi:hypothetical protein